MHGTHGLHGVYSTSQSAGHVAVPDPCQLYSPRPEAGSVGTVGAASDTELVGLRNFSASETAGSDCHGVPSHAAHAAHVGVGEVHGDFAAHATHVREGGGYGNSSAHAALFARGEGVYREFAAHAANAANAVHVLGGCVFGQKAAHAALAAQAAWEQSQGGGAAAGDAAHAVWGGTRVK